MSEQKVLFVLTGHDRLGPANDGSAEKTGFHLAEAARPWRILRDAGFTVDIATPRGGKAPVDPGSHDLDDEDNAAFLGDERIAKQLEDAPALGDVDLDDYAGLYFPGGHGTMWDLPDNEDVQNAVRRMFEDRKLIAAICHGPAAFVNVKLSDGSWFVAGKTLAAFTDEEEKHVGKDGLMPFMLASTLEEKGATIRMADKFGESVAIDGRLVTGQNPASAKRLGEAMVDVLKEQAKKAA